MIKKFKNIASLLLLVILLFPSLVKFEHHHNSNNYVVKGDLNGSAVHEKCDICSFDFSLFSNDSQDIVLRKDNPLSDYRNNYESVYYLSPSQILCSLRAPPCNLV